MTSRRLTTLCELFRSVAGACLALAVVLPISPRPSLAAPRTAVATAAFLDSIESRNPPKCSGRSARQSLGVALSILDKIEEHSEVVSRSLEAGWKP